jgi:hypothetical protein
MVEVKSHLVSPAVQFVTSERGDVVSPDVVMNRNR